MTTLNDFTPLQGGVPIMIDGQVVGAIGVSGAASAQQDEDLAIAGAMGVSGNTPQEDEDIAMAGVKAFGADTAKAKPVTPKLTYFPAAQVNKAFEKGMPLLEIANYKIHASHRDAPGIAEVHTKDTDIIYMLEGSATFVTGGTVVDGKNIETEEIRGKEINGGDVRTITKGDVIVVPHGTPHWFKEVKGPLNYYVVKVRAAN
jgi:glc operon protein GlcG